MYKHDLPNTALAFKALEPRSVIGYRKDAYDKQLHIVIAILTSKGTTERDLGPFGNDELRVKDLIAHMARVSTLPNLTIRGEEPQHYQREPREHSWIVSEAQRAAKIRTTKGIVNGSPKLNKRMFSKHT